MTRAHFKFLAKRQLDGKVGTFFLASLLMVAIFAATLIILAVVIAVSLTLDGVGAIIAVVFALLGYVALVVVVGPALTLGNVMLYQYVSAHPGEYVKATYIFKGFKNFWGAFKVQFFCGLFTFLWTLLFIIPGFIKTFSYSQAMLIYAENPEMGALEAISRSKMIMRGRKFDYYVLFSLSFYPWLLLAPVTLFILFVWLTPYMNLTAINFYNYAKRVPGSPVYGIPAYGEIIPAYEFMPNRGKDPYQENLTQEEPIVEESIAEEPVDEEAVAEEPVVEEPVVEEAVIDEAEAAIEETVIEESDKDTSEESEIQE